MDPLEALRAAVERQTSVTDGAIALVKGAAQIVADNAKEDETQLALAATLNANADKFAEALKSNTSTAATEGAAPPSEIVPTPASEAPVTPPADTPPGGDSPA